MLLNKQQITEEIKKEKKFLETIKHNDPKTLETTKAVLRRKFITAHSYIRKQEKSQVENWTLHWKQLENEEKTKPKFSRRKEITNIRAEINEIELKKAIAKINETKSWFFEKTKKIEKTLARLIKKKREKTQSVKLEMKEEKL